jgi:hypothetical protein
MTTRSDSAPAGAAGGVVLAASSMVMLGIWKVIVGNVAPVRTGCS